MECGNLCFPGVEFFAVDRRVKGVFRGEKHILMREMQEGTLMELTVTLAS